MCLNSRVPWQVDCDYIATAMCTMQLANMNRYTQNFLESQLHDNTVIVVNHSSNIVNIQFSVLVIRFLI